jgi:hypothetical protein
MAPRLLQIFRDFLAEGGNWASDAWARAEKKVAQYYESMGQGRDDAARLAQAYFNRMIDTGGNITSAFQDIIDRDIADQALEDTAPTGATTGATTDPATSGAFAYEGSPFFGGTTDPYGTEVVRPFADVFRQEMAASPFARFLPRAVTTRGAEQAQTQFALQGGGAAGTPYGLAGEALPTESAYRTFLKQGAPLRGEDLLSRLESISQVIGQKEPSLAGITGWSPLDKAASEQFADPRWQYQAFLEPFQQRTAYPARTGMQNYFERVFDLFQRENPTDPNFLKYALGKFAGFLKDTPEMGAERLARRTASMSGPSWEARYA